MYGLIYAVLFIRSHRHLRALRRMESEADEVAVEIETRHRAALLTWAADYGGSMDDAARIGFEQGEMLLQRATHRLRRRIASHALVRELEAMADLFFEKLPEASKGLRDVATEYRHSRLHYIFPRKKEMGIHVELAQYREVHARLQLAAHQLSGPEPDPREAERAWVMLVRFARMFPNVVPADTLDRVELEHGRALQSVVRETDAELEELDRRLAELAHGLGETLSTVAPVVESMVELTSEAIREEMAEYSREVLRVRELARVEAMAFEI